MSPEYLDPRTGETFPLDQPRWCGPGQTPLLLTPLAGITRAQIGTATRSLWRYRAALPFQPDDPITMGEGCTPLIRRTLHGASALLKCEWFMPTGSFKDRGASVMLSLLRAQGVREVLEDIPATAAPRWLPMPRRVGCTPRSWRPPRPAQRRRCRCARMAPPWN
jgi:threonine synthase